MIRFIDRKEEMRFLDADWKRGAPAFVVVFGRRRMGKTRLISEFLKGKDGVSYTAGDVSKKIQLDEFRKALAAYLKDDFLAAQEMGDWSSLFSYLAKTLDKKKRFYLWIDEFSYMVKNDRSITSALQRFIDGFLRDSNLFMVVSGSLYGLMSELVLSHSSPLYGRRTKDILLRPIPAPYAGEFLRFGFQDSLKTVLTVGGIPEYLLVASKYRHYDDFIRAEFLMKDGYFYREPYFIFSQEFREIKTYFSIINAIAYGNTQPSLIANFAGLRSREIYPYLELLISHGFVGRETSLTGSRKNGIYYIKENFLDFWFNFVHRNREHIESNSFRYNERDIRPHLGKRFEIFLRENFMLFFPGFEKYGRWWHKGDEIDIVALDAANNRALFAECKWEGGVNAAALAADLERKTALVKSRGEERKESLVLFARSFRKKISKLGKKEVVCMDLNDIKRALDAAKAAGIRKS